MIRTLPALAVCALLVASGVAAGVWTHRWTPARDLDAAAARLSGIPEVVGDWVGQPIELPPGTLAGGQLAGIEHRGYVNRRTGASVKLLAMCGNPGPVSVHTPDICYRNSGFDEVAPSARVDIPGGGQFLVRRFQKQAAVPTPVTVWYAWSADGVWEAPENPRLRYAPQPILHKIYVISEQPKSDKEPAHDFLAALLPQLRPTLFASAIAP